MMKNKTNVKWKKRAATIVMSLCLLMGLMPIKVFAAGSSAQLPVYTFESEVGDYVECPGVTATFTSSTPFTLGASNEYSNCVRLDYYNPNVYPGVYSRAVTPQVRQAGNRLSGLTETAYASLLA